MQYIFSNTGDEGSIYAARQGMRACNNNNMRNPYYGVTHVIIVACPHSLWGYACYYCCMPSFPVLLHIYCPHPLSCCKYTAPVSLLFGIVIRTSFNILWKCFYFLVSLVFHSTTQKWQYIELYSSKRGPTKIPL